MLYYQNLSRREIEKWRKEKRRKGEKEKRRKTGAVDNILLT